MRTQRDGWTPVARAAELRGDGPFAVSGRDHDLVLVRTRAGVLRAFEGRCPHQGALLGEGELTGDVLICRNHRWRFAIETGQRANGHECLRACSVGVEDGVVHVDTSSLTSRSRATNAARGIADLPRVAGLPFVGNLLQLDLSRLHVILEGWSRRLGPLYVFRAPRPIVAISELRAIEQVLRARPETFRRLKSVEPVMAEMGMAGVFSAEGAAWRPQRRLAMQALSPRNLRGMYPSLRLVAERLGRRWNAAAQRGRPVDLLDDLKRFTTDLTSLLVFGHDLNTLEADGSGVMQRRLELLMPAINRRMFAVLPVWRFLRMPRDKRLDEALTGLRSWIGDLIATTRRRLETEPTRAERPANFLEAMVSMRDDEGAPFPDEVICGNALTMLLAGTDTTASTLAWGIHALCASPASVKGLQSEIDGVLGPTTVPADTDTVEKLVYAGAVANEAMRLKPVGVLHFAEALEDVVVGDVALPRGQAVVLLTRVPATDPCAFAAPDTFKPERWLAPEGAHDPTASLPFGSGPRMCPGRTLAMLAMRVGLATLYRSFNVRRTSPREAQEVFALAMAPDEVTVTLESRDPGPHVANTW